MTVRIDNSGVDKFGAQTGMPTAEEVETELKKQSDRQKKKKDRITTVKGVEMKKQGIIIKAM